MTEIRISQIPKRLSDEAAHEWGISPRLALLIFLAPFAGAVVVAAARLDLGIFQFLTGEDGMIEWLQFAAYGTTALLAVLVARQLLAEELRLYAAVYIAVGVAAFVVAGEEVSWGQRIFGVETPEALEALNRQGELGAHNIHGVETAFNLGQLAVGFYGSLGAWAIRLRTSPPQSPATALFVPALFLGSFFLLAFLHRLVRFTVPDVTDVTTFVKFGEWPELCLALGAMSVCALNLRRLRAPELSAATP